MDALAILAQHRPYMSDEDEASIIASSCEVEDFDAANLAVRTCRCGKAIDGFDGYVDHLQDLFEEIA